MVNDNSQDRTAEVIRAFGQQDPAIRTVDRTPPGGFGRAVRSGLELVSGDVVVVYMADSSDHPSDVVAYYRKIEEGYDCVFGSRFIKGSKVVAYPPLKLVINRVVNKAIQYLFRCPFNDLTNAFKAYRTHVLHEAGPFRASHFNITIEMSLAALIRDYHIAQIPISWTGRTWGSSNLRLKEMGRRYLSTLVKVVAEKYLIRDDLLAERLAEHGRQKVSVLGQEKRIQHLEERLSDLEHRIDRMETPGPGKKAA